jgi:hypothetical protein
MTAYPALPEFRSLSRTLPLKLGNAIPADRMRRRLLPDLLVVLVRHDILAHTHCRRRKKPESCVSAPYLQHRLCGIAREDLPDGLATVAPRARALQRVALSAADEDATLVQ